MTEQSSKQKLYKLLGPDGKIRESQTPGTLGGNRSTKIYGQLDCRTAHRWIEKSDVYAQFRVFFADEETAVAAGFRPCHNCMPEAYRRWKAGPQEGQEFPWRLRKR